jgi:hypothetical protein
MVDFSQDRRHVWGFSMITGGKWSEADAPPGATFDLNRISLSTKVAVVFSGDRLYGFGADAGHWDAIDLPPRAGADVYPWISPNSIWAYYKAQIWAFSSTAAKWQEIDTAHP